MEATPEMMLALLPLPRYDDSNTLKWILWWLQHIEVDFLQQSLIPNLATSLQLSFEPQFLKYWNKG